MRTDPVQLEILRNRFKAIVEEMASVTLRTGFTVFVKETSDFGACLVAPNGEVLCAPTDTAVSLMIGLPGWEVINAFESYEEGDVGIANDPDRTRGLSTHLPDIWLWKPIFVEGEIVAFAFNFIHSSDVGGRVPGSISPTSTDIFQEGLRIPPLKLMKAGVLNQDIVDLILLNCRIPAGNWGDIKAQFASIATAERRVHELAARYGKQCVTDGIVDLMDAAETRARRMISRIPDGIYRASDYMEAEAGAPRPIRIAIAMIVQGDSMTLDFTGTDLQVPAAFNLPSWGQAGHYMLSYALVNYFRTLDPDIPYNSGMVRPVAMVLPQGSIVNPDPGLACGVRAATFIRVMDCILACLAQALPDATPAASSGAIAIVLLSALDAETGERHITVAQPINGGSGGRPRQDGIEGTSFTGGWLRNVPNEVLEAEMPVLVEEYGYADGSGAPGTYRGGAAIVFRLRNMAPGTIMTARGLERFRFRPWGVRGGAPGTPARVTLNPGRSDARDLGQFDLLNLEPDDVVEFRSPSGGGFGPALRRAPEAVLRDVRSGFVDPAAALRDYGVVVTEAGVDIAATQCARAGRAEATEAFAYGPERAAFEAIWPEALQDALIKALMACPPGRRGFVRRKIEPMLDAEVRAGRKVDPASVAQMVRDAIGPLRHKETMP